MRRPAALFPIVLSLGAAIVPGPGAQAAPTAITTCQTITAAGSYVLEGNLVTIGTCLVINAGNVTIDLAGFQISARSRGITASAGTSGITVRNGSIEVGGGGGGTGVSLGDGSIVEGLRISLGPMPGGAQGIIAKGIVRGNTVITIGPGPGGSSGQIGINASGTITDNYVSGVSQGKGIVAGVGSTVIGNTATGNNVGIEAACPANLTNNTAVNNVMNLVLTGSDPASCANTNNVM